MGVGVVRVRVERGRARRCYHPYSTLSTQNTALLRPREAKMEGCTANSAILSHPTRPLSRSPTSMLEWRRTARRAPGRARAAAAARASWAAGAAGGPLGELRRDVLERREVKHRPRGHPVAPHVGEVVHGARVVPVGSTSRGLLVSRPSSRFPRGFFGFRADERWWGCRGRGRAFRDARGTWALSSKRAGATFSLRPHRRESPQTRRARAARCRGRSRTPLVAGRHVARRRLRRRPRRAAGAAGRDASTW